MHESVMNFVRRSVERHDVGNASPVLEVGGYDVNGSVRQFFSGGYVSIDMRDGPGVDVVMNAHELGKHYDGIFEVVVCTEMLEHDDDPFLSLANMWTALKPGGLLILTCRGYDERGCFPVHDYPDDLWRFSVQGIERMLSAWHVIGIGPDPEAPGVFAEARRV